MAFGKKGNRAWALKIKIIAPKFVLQFKKHTLLSHPHRSHQSTNFCQPQIPDDMLKKDYSKTKKVCKVTFSLSTTAVQDGGEVRVLGDFNGWAWDNGLVMKAGKTEYTASIELALGANYEFRYAINNERWENDWAADAYVPSPFDGINNSLVSVSAVVDGELTGKAEGGKKVKATGAPKVEEKPAAAAKADAPKAEKPKAPAKAKAPAKTTTTTTAKAKTATKAPAKSKAKEETKK